eukprot:308951_1
MIAMEKRNDGVGPPATRGVPPKDNVRKNEEDAVQEGEESVSGVVGDHSSDESDHESMYENNDVYHATTTGRTLGHTTTGGCQVRTTSGIGANNVTGQCVDCGVINNGKLYGGDGQFYCNKCWT